MLCTMGTQQRVGRLRPAVHSELCAASICKHRARQGRNRLCKMPWSEQPALCKPTLLFRMAGSTCSMTCAVDHKWCHDHLCRMRYREPRGANWVTMDSMGGCVQAPMNMTTFGCFSRCISDTSALKSYITVYDFRRIAISLECYAPFTD